ncbi:MAG: hypothetical protein ACKPKO_36565, partial [Candidatus Fonsibacter sp.]
MQIVGTTAKLNHQLYQRLSGGSRNSGPLVHDQNYSGVSGPSVPYGDGESQQPGAPVVHAQVSSKMVAQCEDILRELRSTCDDIASLT